MSIMNTNGNGSDKSPSKSIEYITKYLMKYYYEQPLPDVSINLSCNGSYTKPKLEYTSKI